MTYDSFADDRRVAILRARNLLNLRPLILDTETTGLETGDEVIDIAIINWEGAVAFESLVHPSQAIPPEATQVHGITDEMAANAPRFIDLWYSELRSVLTGQRLRFGQPICAYNADFDYRMIQQSLRQFGAPVTGLRSFVCLMELYAEFFGEWQDYRGSYRWQKLSDAAEQCGLAVNGAHRAVNDCQTALAVLRYMASQPVEIMEMEE